MEHIKDLNSSYKNGFISLQNVSFKYENNSQSDDIDAYILDGLNLNINQGSFIAILGHNGSGKSTLAKHFNAILLPSGGKVVIDNMLTQDEDFLYEIRRRVGLVLQNPDNQLVSSIVEEDIAFGPENLGIPPEEIRKRVDDALKAVDMYEYRLSSPYKLSGGQKQRIAIAGIIAMHPKCIVFDEPTAMLDPKGRKEVIDTIKKLNKQDNITIILITHHMDEAVQADEIAVMKSGKILKKGKPREMFSDVKSLEENGLKLPQVTELIYKLKSYGYSLPDGVLDEEECTAVLEQLLEAKICR